MFPLVTRLKARTATYTFVAACDSVLPLQSLAATGTASSVEWVSPKKGSRSTRSMRQQAILAPELPVAS